MSEIMILDIRAETQGDYSGGHKFVTRSNFQSCIQHPVDIRYNTSEIILEKLISVG